MKIQRNSIFFKILLAIGGLCIIGGILLIATDSIHSLYILFGGVGLVLLLQGITEKRKRFSKILIIAAFLLYGLAFLTFSYNYFLANRLITTSIFAAIGILTLIFASFFMSTKDDEHED